MPEGIEPNGQPAASDAAGQRPTTDGTQSSTATDQQQATPASGQDDASQDQQKDIHDPEKKRLSDEAAKWRKAAREAEARAKKYEDAEQAKRDAELPAIERAEKRAADSERKYADSVRAFQERFISLTIQAQASKLNIIDPDAAVKLMDWTQLEYDDDGIPTNADKVLADLVKTRSYLVATPAAQTTTPQAGNASTDAHAALAAQLGATNPTRQNGPVTVTANQYMDKAFKADFKVRYGMDLEKAVLSGKATIV